MNTPDRLEFRYSRPQQLALLLTSIAIITVSWFVAATTGDVVYRFVGWFAVAFFALCGVIAARRMIGGGTPFVFDVSGISFPGGSFGLLPWSEVKEYGVITVRGNQFLALTFHDPDRTLSRMPAAKRRWASINHRFGWGHWALTFSGVTPGMQEAIAFIENRCTIPRAA